MGCVCFLKYIFFGGIEMDNGFVLRMVRGWPDAKGRMEAITQTQTGVFELDPIPKEGCAIFIQDANGAIMARVVIPPPFIKPNRLRKESQATIDAVAMVGMGVTVRAAADATGTAEGTIYQALKRRKVKSNDPE